MAQPRQKLASKLSLGWGVPSAALRIPAERPLVKWILPHIDTIQGAEVANWARWLDAPPASITSYTRHAQLTSPGVALWLPPAHYERDEQTVTALSGTARTKLADALTTVHMPHLLRDEARGEEMLPLFASRTDCVRTLTDAEHVFVVYADDGRTPAAACIVSAGERDLFAAPTSARDGFAAIGRAHGRSCTRYAHSIGIDSCANPALLVRLLEHAQACVPTCLMVVIAPPVLSTLRVLLDAGAVFGHDATPPDADTSLLTDIVTHMETAVQAWHGGEPMLTLIDPYVEDPRVGRRSVASGPMHIGNVVDAAQGAPPTRSDVPGHVWFGADTALARKCVSETLFRAHAGGYAHPVAIVSPTVSLLHVVAGLMPPHTHCVFGIPLVHGGVGREREWSDFAANMVVAGDGPNGPDRVDDAGGDGFDAYDAWDGGRGEAPAVHRWDQSIVFSSRGTLRKGLALKIMAHLLRESNMYARPITRAMREMIAEEQDIHVDAGDRAIAVLDDTPRFLFICSLRRNGTTMHIRTAFVHDQDFTPTCVLMARLILPANVTFVVPDTAPPGVAAAFAAPLGDLFTLLVTPEEVERFAGVCLMGEKNAYVCKD